MVQRGQFIIDNLFLTLDNTAHGLERGGEYDKALEIYCKVLEKRKKLLEPTDNLLLNNQYNIGTVLVNKAKSTKDTGEAVAYCDKMIEQAPDHYKKNFKDLKEEVLGKAQDSSSPKNKKNKLPNISNKIKKILDVDFIAALSNYREVLKYSEINKPGIAHQVGKWLLELYSQILVTYNKLKEAKGQGYPLYGPIVDGFPLIMGDAGEIFRNHERENQIWELKWQKSASKANSKKRERTTDSLEQESLSKKSNTEEQATDFPNTSTTDSVTTASTVSFANTSQSESQLPGKTDDKPRTCLNDPTADKQLQRSL